MVRAIIEAGPDPNKANDDGATPLFIAAQDTQEAGVRLLVEAGVDIDKAMGDVTPVTPPCAAAFRGHGTVFRLLIDAGADETALQRGGNGEGVWCPLR